VTIKISAYISITCEDFTRRICLEFPFNVWHWSRDCKEICFCLRLKAKDLQKERGSAFTGCLTFIKSIDDNKDS
jgi:hypothetical protein